ncbi:MAG: hypothetical protein ACYDGS_10320 [Thermoleophilia bacterium]
MSDILRSNELLLTNQMLTSINGEYVLILQADGNMVLYGKVHHEDGSVILDPAWATETIDETAWYAVMQADGNLVLYNREGVTLWQSETDGRPGSFLQLQDDGNLVINEISHAWMAGSVEDEEEEEEDEDEVDIDEAIDLADQALAQQVEEALADDMLTSSKVTEK